MNKEEQISVLADAFEKFGIKSGEILLVHSSLSSLGHVEGGAESVIAALLSAVGNKGTLLMPALSYETVGDGNPVFDELNTKSCVGAIPQVFRSYPGTLRSLHPTHSVCANGYLAKEMTEKHILDRTPVGKNSPLSLLCNKGGKILMLGCGLLHNTSMHGVEETVVPPYLLMNRKTTYTLIDKNKEIHKGDYTNHNFKGYEQRYDRVKDLLNRDELKRGKVLSAECYLIDSKALWKKGREALLKDNFYFVEKENGQ